jgi:hypothetical protein
MVIIVIKDYKHHHVCMDNVLAFFNNKLNINFVRFYYLKEINHIYSTT